jgi:hypothetical protein
VFGLAFITTFCSVVTVIDLGLLRFLIHLRKCQPFFAPRIDRWIQDGVFQLQRRAYEGEGQGYWKKLNEEVPLTAMNELLPNLPIESKNTKPAQGSSTLFHASSIIASDSDNDTTSQVPQPPSALNDAQDITVPNFPQTPTISGAVASVSPVESQQCVAADRPPSPASSSSVESITAERLESGSPSCAGAHVSLQEAANSSIGMWSRKEEDSLPLLVTTDHAIALR